MPLIIGPLKISWGRSDAIPDHGGKGDAADPPLAEVVLESAYDAESSGRKLAAQVGEAITAAARISSRAARVKGRSQLLHDQVAGGASAIEELSASMDSLSGRIERQAELVEQSAAAIEEMSASIASVAQVSAAKRVAAQGLRESTAAGAKTVSTTDSAIAEVTEQVASVNRMIDVINDIAARTNLLAMNAAIEAAHAGAAGRGFAVVAGEIRTLATTTARNAMEIDGLLKKLVGRIKDAREASTGTQRTFQVIEQGAGEVAEAFEEITGSTQELAAGAREVVTATEELRVIADETRHSSGEMRIGARELAEVVTGASESSTETLEMMSEIVDAAQAVTQASTRITTNTLGANDRTSKLITAVSSSVHATSDDDSALADAAGARQRLEISSLILKHLAWVGRARAMIDGLEAIDPATLLDHTKCDLGVWLATEGKTVVTDRTAYTRLDQHHRSLHDSLRAIVACESDTAAGCIDVEDTFEELMKASHAIVEILTTYQAGESVTWSPRVAVGVDVFDQHHQKLFAYINALYEAVRAGATGEGLLKVFDELLDYTGWHFDAEQSALRHFNYPQCDHHISQHTALVKRVKELRADLAAGRAMVAAEMMEFLRDWVTNHIRGCDRLYGEFFRDKDVAAFVAQHTGQAS